MGKNKITTLSNEYTKEIKKYEDLKIRYKHFSRRRIAGMAIVCIILFTYPAIGLVKSFNDLVAVKSSLSQVKKENEAMSDDVDSNERKVNQLKDDEYVAKVARSKFFYSKDNEKVYRVPELSQDN